MIATEWTVKDEGTFSLMHPITAGSRDTGVRFVAVKVVVPVWPLTSVTAVGVSDHSSPAATAEPLVARSTSSAVAPARRRKDPRRITLPAMPAAR